MGAVKSYRPPKAILAEIQHALSSKPSFNHSPLEEVAALLSEGRHYGWVGIYLTLDRKSVPALVERAIQPRQNQIANASTRKKIIVSVKIAGREVGTLNVESSHEHSFGSEDRVLLERVAGFLAKFLTSSSVIAEEDEVGRAAVSSPSR